MRNRYTVAIWKEIGRIIWLINLDSEDGSWSLIEAQSEAMFWRSQGLASNVQCIVPILAEMGGEE